MDFGKVENEDISQVDFRLPPDAEGTGTTLKKNKALGHTPQIFVGCAKWGRKDWVGKIYPLKTKEADFLNHYAKHFNCIELNATFYRMPTFSQTQGWAAKVGDDFRFCPKFTDQITHIKRLKDVKEQTDRFLEGVSGFGKKLGPLFLMPHPSMPPKTLDTLEAFIQSLPKDLQLFVELRHPQWFSEPEANAAVFNMLERNRAGSIITDASGRRDCVHMHLSTPEAFIRFVGNGLHPTDYTRIDDWVQRIKVWMEQGIDRVYFFMHQHDELHSPELSKYLIQQLNKHCGTKIPEPIFVEDIGPAKDLFGDAPPTKKPAARKETPAKKAPTKKAAPKS
ncbi:Uncharacterized conserved protein YecE, DUF72 family [Chryseolinea serpens]|uniref:Uncharacterized conserved protein YecE, DUF72 family n=1 Tax=Chryseolinea serpens TaxID=947013 RepID=A0A1M5LPF6_9BACT|nr:DUF72 domain-containing protein [Chryseolinea serpens]SHG66941.1 Uncharacterized conserved protein YecE, DUF72 family [Chryseolinea serpens]